MEPQKKFVELMTQPNRIAKLVRCVGNVEKVVLKMMVQRVLNAEDRQLILGQQMRLHQKHALIEILARKKFEFINRMIYAMYWAENPSACVLLKTLKYLVFKSCNLDSNVASTLLERPIVPKFGIQAGHEHSSNLENLSLALDLLNPRTANVRNEVEHVRTPPRFTPVVPGRETYDSESYIRNDVVLLELEDLKLKLEDVKSVATLISEDPDTYQTSLHACFMRSNEVLACMQLLLSKFEQLQTQPEASETQKVTVEDLINHQDKRKQAVAHLAAKRSLVTVLLMLHKRRCNFFLEDEQGFTAMRLMYLHAPEAVSEILNDAITPLDGFDFGDNRNFKVEFDFCTVVGKSAINFQDKKADTFFEETELLRELIIWNRAGAKRLLPHLAIRVFLELKWARMKFWFNVSLVVQLFLHLLFTLFVIQVFLIDCRHVTAVVETNSRNFTNIEAGITDNDLPKHFYNYLFGTWKPVKQVFEPTSDQEAQHCALDGFQFVVFIFLLFSSGLLPFVKEMFKLYLKGTSKYFLASETLLQLASIFCILWVTSSAFSQTLTDSHYTWAAIGIIISWSLILMRLGNFFGMGLYVQMLGKVIKRFFTMMCVYIVIIIAFSIAFSIMFPQEEPFKTLPRAISRIVIMMTGELDYKETFYGSNTGGPPIPLPSHMIFACFAILLTIILMNWLIGMIVSDVNLLKEKSEVVLMSIKIDHISFMERSLIRLHQLVPQRILQYFYNRRNRFSAIFSYLDTHVIPLNQGSASSNVMVIEKQINDIPKWLRKPLIHFATTGKDHTSELQILD